MRQSLRRRYFHLLILLLCALAVYRFCQEDDILPVAAGVAMIASYIARQLGPKHRYQIFARIPLSVVIISSFLAGLFWRLIMPAPELAISPFPAFTAALQSGAIVAALLIWFRPYTEANSYALMFSAWLITALSVNIPFHSVPVFFSFFLFCTLTPAIVIMNTTRRPQNKEHLFRYFRDFILYSLLFMGLTLASFIAIARSVVLIDDTYMRLIQDFIMPQSYTHFLNISPQLNLTSPGRSAFDRRPVLEITAPEQKGLYLRTQIFADYDNGTWTEDDTSPLSALPADLPETTGRARMIMFTSLENIVPSPPGVMAARGSVPYAINADGIIYTPDDQQTRIIDLALTDGIRAVRLSPQIRQRYLTVPPEIRPELAAFAGDIVGDAKHPLDESLRLRNFFKDNFDYTLDVRFTADDNGLLRMLNERKPAYCSYFASAMALLLRSRGIPARVAAGFYSAERINRRNNTFIVRVNQAHAWTEALLPIEDSQTGETHWSWQIFDPTPAVAFTARVDYAALIAERIWLAGVRLRAMIENIDREIILNIILAGLVMMLIWMNRRSIAAALRRNRQRLAETLPEMIRPPTPAGRIYRQYEKFLKDVFKESRGPSDTDRDVMERLRRRTDISAGMMTRIEAFIARYQAARFGREDAAMAGECLEELQRQAG